MKSLISDLLVVAKELSVSGMAGRMPPIRVSKDDIEILRFVRMGTKGDSNIELFHLERSGEHFFYQYGGGFGITYEIFKGSSSSVDRKFNQIQDNLMRGVALYQQPMEIKSRSVDGDAKKHLRILDSEFFGVDWDNVDEADAIDDIEDFNRLLKSQTKNWKGSPNSLSVTNHKYWPEFKAMLTKAVSKKYGSRITLYRGIHGDQAKKLLNGESLSVGTFSSWAVDRSAADVYRGYRDYWVVVRIDVPASRVAFAPVVIPDYIEPNVLSLFSTDIAHNGDELVVETKSKRISNFKIVSKTRKAGKELTGGRSEKEVERLMKDVLKGTPFANKAFAVGGYIRDELIGIDSKDLDVVVEMKDGARKLTEFMHKEFSDVSRPRQMGAGYPIWQITFKKDITYKGEKYATRNAVIEFADTQKESFPDPDSRQRVVEHGTLDEDAARRDFTVNMLTKDLTTGELKDLTGTSINDIRKGILRGHPGVDFNKIVSEDPLRMIRLVRFQVKYGWKVPLDVLRIVKANAERIKIVSAERIHDELVKIMNVGKLGKAIKLMKLVGLLKHILPEIEVLKDTMHDTSRGHHQEGDVFRHTMLVLQGAKPGVESQLAALLHDVGKPATMEQIGDKIQFLGHETVGAEMAEAIMRRLKFDSATVKTVKKLVENHMKPHGLDRTDGKVSDKALRKFIRKIGEGMVDSILDLAEADALGNLPPRNYVPELRERIDAVRNAPIQISEKTVLDGNAIQRLLGIKPGPIVGEAIKFLIDQEDEYASSGKQLSEKEAEKLLLEKFGE